jgi:acetyl esterase
MSLDPQAKAFLDLVNVIAASKPPMHELGAVKAREVAEERPDHLSPEFVEIYKVEDRILEEQGLKIPSRIYTPTKTEALLPVFMFYHGGGMVIGTLDSYDTLCRQIAHQAQCIVVSVDYRLAPENKFPAAVDDSYAALCWLVNNAETIQADPNNIAIGGDSAGGSLTAVCALLARDNQLSNLQGQILIYPATAPHADAESHFTFAKGYFLERETVLWFHNCYIRNDDDRKDFRYAPLIAEDHSNLPPALVIIAGYDTLRDEGIAYAEKLQAAGCQVELQEYKGMFHPFVSMAGILDDGKKAISEVAKSLRSFFEK